jgi:hypothetical protein
MERINGQMQDLRDVFAKWHYAHPGFRGSTSIKAVMPVLVPELSYDDLEIKEGATASEQWWKMTAEDIPAGERLPERLAHFSTSLFKGNSCAPSMWCPRIEGRRAADWRSARARQQDLSTHGSSGGAGAHCSGGGPLARPGRQTIGTAGNLPRSTWH